MGFRRRTPIISERLWSGCICLPTLVVDGQTLLQRMALVVDDGTIVQVFYPVFPPDRNAGDVLAWLQANPKAGA
jgi:peroxiredoxin